MNIEFQVSLNRNIVECKCIIYTTCIHDNYSLNRNIVECKFQENGNTTVSKTMFK